VRVRLPGLFPAAPTYQWAQEVDGRELIQSPDWGPTRREHLYRGQHTVCTFPCEGGGAGRDRIVGLYRINGSAWTALALSSVYSIVADPQSPATLYASSGGSLLKSTDGGASFAATGLPSSEAESIAIEPGNYQVLFVATFDRGVQRSADGGATWVAVNNGLPVQTGGLITVQNLWIDPTHPAVMFAQTPYNGLVRTADGAATWQMTTIPDNIQALTFDPAHPGVIYVSGYHSGLMQSTDDGQTFHPFSVPAGCRRCFRHQAA